MEEPKYMLICNHCGHKDWSDGKPMSLQELKVAPVPLRADGKSKDVAKMTKRYKCTSCGYIMKPVKIVKPEEEKELLPQPKTKGPPPKDLNNNDITRELRLPRELNDNDIMRELGF